MYQRNTTNGLNIFACLIFTIFSKANLHYFPDQGGRKEYFKASTFMKFDYLDTVLLLNTTWIKELRSLLTRKYSPIGEYR